MASNQEKADYAALRAYGHGHMEALTTQLAARDGDISARDFITNVRAEMAQHPAKQKEEGQ